jgi:hypothetical protein
MSELRNGWLQQNTHGVPPLSAALCVFALPQLLAASQQWRPIHMRGTHVILHLQEQGVLAQHIRNTSFL